MKTFIALLKGKKTYILGALMFATSLVHLLTGDMTLAQFLTSVSGLIGFNGLGLVTLRAALAKNASIVQ